MSYIWTHDAKFSVFHFFFQQKLAIFAVKQEKEENMRKLLFLCLWSMSLPLSAQTAIDTLTLQFEEATGQQRIETANQVMNLLHQKEVTDSLIQFDHSTKDETVMAEVYFWVGENKFLDDLDFKCSAMYFEKALALIPEENVERRSDCLNDLSISYAREGLYSQALTAATQTVHLDEQLNDKERLMYSLNNLGGIYMMAKQTEKARKYILRSLELARELNDSIRIAVRLGSLAEQAQYDGNYDQALKYAYEAFVLDSLRGDEMKMAVRQVQMANALTKTGDLTRADELMKAANPILSDGGNFVSLAICLNQQGYVAYCNGQWKQAADYYSAAYAIYDRTGDRHSKLTTLWGLWHSYSHLNPDKAFKYMEHYSTLKDSLYQDEVARLGADYDARYENEKLNMQNEEMKSHNRRIVIGSAVAIGGLLIVIALLAYTLRQRSHTSRLQQVLREERSSKKIANRDVEFLNKVDDLLMKQIRECNVSLENIASDLFITRQQLNRKVKALLGENMRDHVNRIRTELACKLLTENEKNVSEIARDCGFDDVAYFSRFFRKMTGQAPTEYRDKTQS